jgi:hypothetical protein
MGVFRLCLAVSTASLYGGAHRVDNPREYQKVDAAGARPQQRPGAGIRGGTGSEHIVDQNETAARHLGLALGGHAKGALHILGALGCDKPNLLRGCLDALEDGVGDLNAAFLRDRLASSAIG